MKKTIIVVCIAAFVYIALADSFVNTRDGYGWSTVFTNVAQNMYGYDDHGAYVYIPANFNGGVNLFSPTGTYAQKVLYFTKNTGAPQYFSKTFRWYISKHTDTTITNDAIQLGYLIQNAYLPQVSELIAFPSSNLYGNAYLFPTVTTNGYVDMLIEGMTTNETVSVRFFILGVNDAASYNANAKCYLYHESGY